MSTWMATLGRVGACAAVAATAWTVQGKPARYELKSIEALGPLGHLVAVGDNIQQCERRIKWQLALGLMREDVPDEAARERAKRANFVVTTVLERRPADLITSAHQDRVVD